jgi:hypothetical protein
MVNTVSNLRGRMADDLDFLVRFPKEHNGMYIVYELYTFDNLFRLLLKSNFDHEEALAFVLFNCSLSALVFQERIHNKGYRKLSAKDALSADLAARKAQLIYDLMSLG